MPVVALAKTGVSGATVRDVAGNANIIESITAVLATLEAELEATRKAIHDHIDKEPELKRRRDLPVTIPGLCDASIALMPVVLSDHHGFLTAKQVGSRGGEGAKKCGIRPLLAVLQNSGRNLPVAGVKTVKKVRRQAFAGAGVTVRCRV